jgi:predicted enzyme related to lactoylglutathione lyase
VSKANPFVWYELLTTDQPAAGAFYQSVVGWKMTDAGQPGMKYTILHAGETPIGGLMAMPPAESCENFKPGWIGYIGVDDVDAAAKRVSDGGGSIQRAPDDIPNVGRFAVVADPGGAVFVLFQPGGFQPQGPSAAPGTPGHVGWHELYAGNGEAAAMEFYAKQFGWTTDREMDMGPMGKYRIFATGGPGVGGMMTKPPQVPQSAWVFYFNVPAIDAAVERVNAGGGKILMPPMQVPGGGWVIQAVDPQGAVFALFAPTR